METEQRMQRIAEVQEHIFSGAFARTKREDTAEEPEKDDSYRVECNEERSREALTDFLGGKMFVRKEEGE